MTDSPLDAEPDDRLERAFRPPQYIAEDEELNALYEEMVGRLRAEALGIPMHTMQQFLIERIATKYVIIRYREEHGWVGINTEKEFNQQWLELLKEWNRVLQSSQEQMRDALLREAEKISVDAVNLVPDPETRQALRRHFKERYAALGH